MKESIPVRSMQYAGNELSASSDFSIRSIRTILNGRDMVQTIHRHDFFYILILNKGSGSHEIDFQSYRIENRSVFFMRPGQVHRITLKAGSEGYLLVFKPGFYRPVGDVSNQLLRQVSDKIFCRLDSSGFKRLMETARSIFREYSEKQEGHVQVIKATLEIFFIELVRHRKRPRSYVANVPAYTQQRFAEFITLLEKNYGSKKRVSMYASMMNLSVFQLNSITRTSTGKTCSELINDQIILESKRFLLATAEQVSQIAFRVGYDDVSYFIRFFKKHTGYSPASFRQNFR